MFGAGSLLPISNPLRIQALMAALLSICAKWFCTQA
jgi:hypothetical protein